MKIVDAVWEQRNLGVTCYEITFDTRDSLDDIKARWDELTDRQYLVFKVPPKRAEIVAFIQSRGFRFIEVSMNMYCDLRDWTLKDEFKPICEQCTYAPMNDDDIQTMFTEIKRGIFKTDRVYLDPYFTHEQAAQRYVNWAQDMIRRGVIPHKVMYQGETVGFFCGDLSGVYSSFENSGFGFLIQCAGIKKASDDGKKFSTAKYSSNNPSVLNVIIALGYRIKTMEYVFIRHNDSSRKAGVDREV